MVMNFVVFSEQQLAQLFDAQMSALERSGAGRAIIERLRALRNEVMAEARDTAYLEGHLPFAPKITGDGVVGFVYDVAPPPAGFLPVGVGLTALAASQPVGSQPVGVPIVGATMSSALKAVAAVAGPKPLAIRSRQAVLAYARGGFDIPPGLIIDLYV